MLVTIGPIPRVDWPVRHAKQRRLARPPLVEYSLNLEIRLNSVPEFGPSDASFA